MEECNSKSYCSICLNSITKKYIMIHNTKYECISKNDIYDRLHRGLNSYPIAINNYSYNICKLECNHKFHKKCLFEWFNKSLTCPLCRTRIRYIL